MSQPDQSPNWRCLHVHVPSAARLDRLVAETLPQLFSGPEAVLANYPYFFVRYGEGGAHLRLRVMAPTEEIFSTARMLLSRAVQNAAGNDYVADGASWSATIAEPGGAAFRQPGSVLECPYVPEVQRYGGPAALPASERLFCAASRIALHLVAATAQNRAARLSHAVALMLATGAVLYRDPVRVGHFFRGYYRGWEDLLSPSNGMRSAAGYDKDAIVALAHDLTGRSGPPRPGNTPVSRWSSALDALLAELRRHAHNGVLIHPHSGAVTTGAEQAESAVAQIVASQMHMLNNRLGLPPAEEMAWSDACACALALPDYEQEATPSAVVRGVQVSNWQLKR
jgi:thiopeptide-type bacteriocin biosynthesis protein